MKIKREVRTTVYMDIDSLNDIEPHDLINVDIVGHGYAIECMGINRILKESGQNVTLAMFIINNAVDCPIEFDNCDKNIADEWLNSCFRPFLSERLCSDAIQSVSCATFCENPFNHKTTNLLGVRFIAKFMEAA